MRIFIALLIYIGIVGASNIRGYWDKTRNTIHRPMESITLFRFQQILQYGHMSTSVSNHLPTACWHTKLEPLASLLRIKFKAYVVLCQDVSFDEMMGSFAGRSKHTLKIKNKPVKEGFI
jgi:Transposase IS4